MTVGLIIDFAMIFLILFTLSYRIMGDIRHEWIGVPLRKLMSEA
jgi:Mn2+/Fe2+ NRAMP family transporter